MNTRSLGLVVGSMAVWMCAGCRDGAFSFNYYDDPPPQRVTVVQVEPGHVCTPACAHYYDGARYVVIRGRHRHGHRPGVRSGRAQQEKQQEQQERAPHRLWLWGGLFVCAADRFGRKYWLAYDCNHKIGRASCRERV